MKPNVEQAIREHAVAEYPRECCGLLVVVKGKERYLPCRNIAEGRNDFIMHPEDATAAEDIGDVIAVVHSHPDGGTQPSQADRVQCAESGMPWYIVSVNKQGDTSDIVRHEPAEYTAPLIGRHFAHGVLDCYTLLRDYYSRVVGIVLPDFHRDDNWWNKGEDLYMQHFAEAGFEPIKGQVQEHDIILMQVRSPVANHAGVYIGNGMMLHHMYGRLSTREIYGGHFQEITRLIVRNKQVASWQTK